MKQNGLHPGMGSPLNGNVMVRAVVTTTYAADEETRPSMQGQFQPKSVTCDVLTYGGRHRAFLHRVPVVQTRHGLNDYLSTWIPRATTKNLSNGDKPRYALEDGQPADDPRDWDGDHVLVQFLENDPMQPIITGALPHPRSNFRQIVSDGEAVRSRHRGTKWEIDQNGSIRVDTRSANSGDLDNDGAEPAADTAAHGKVTLLMPNKTTLLISGMNVDGTGKEFELTMLDNEFEIRLNNGATFKLNGEGLTAIARVGDGAKSAAVAEDLQTLWTTNKVSEDAFYGALNLFLGALTTFMTQLALDMGIPSGAPVLVTAPAATIAMPVFLTAATTFFTALGLPPITPTPHQAWNAALINSAHLKIPSNP